MMAHANQGGYEENERSFVRFVFHPVFYKKICTYEQRKPIYATERNRKRPKPIAQNSKKEVNLLAHLGEISPSVNEQIIGRMALVHEQRPEPVEQRPDERNRKDGDIRLQHDNAIRRNDVLYLLSDFLMHFHRYR